MTWNGKKAFSWCVACKLHFTNKSFNISSNKSFLKCSYETYEHRKDYKLFELIPNQFKERDWLYICACNMMYGNFNVVYDLGTSIANFNLFNARREAFDFMLQTDYNALYSANVLKSDAVNIVRLLTQNRITFETVVTLNRFLNVTEKIRNNKNLGAIVSMLEPLLLRIDKAPVFIRIGENKLNTIINNSFNQDNTFNTNIFN